MLVPVCGLVAAALVFALRSETEKARLVETARNFPARLVDQSLVLNPFSVIDNSLSTWASFTNPLLALVVIGAIFLARKKPSSYKILVPSWMTVTDVGTFFVVALQTETWRIWYVQPLWLIAAAGVGGLLRFSNSWICTTKVNVEVVMAVVTIIFGGLALLFLEPILGSWLFCVVAILQSTDPEREDKRGQRLRNRAYLPPKRKPDCPLA